MSGFLYWPYDEVVLEASADRRTVTVKTPWLTASVKGPLTPEAHFESLLQKFHERSLAPTDIGLRHWFFSPLVKYPLCYILPTPKKQATDAHVIQEASLANASLDHVLDLALQKSGTHTEDERRTIISTVMSGLPRRTFLWDNDTVLAFSKQGAGIHPESAFSVARRYHILELLEQDKGKEVFKRIEDLPKNDFVKMAARIVKQNLYVTQECQRALTPALEIAQSARPAIEHFIQQERGHDRLLGMALNALIEDPSTVRVTSHTISLMSLLQLAARKNFLAFAIAVDFFERSSYEKTDPLAQLLQKGGFIEAARQINRHMEINDAGEHENMGLRFLASMAPCAPEYVREAFTLAEAISLVMNSVTQSTLTEAKL